MRRDPTEPRRAEHDAGKHLTHDFRLLNLLEERRHKARNGDHNADLQDQSAELHGYRPSLEDGLCRWARKGTGVQLGQPAMLSVPIRIRWPASLAMSARSRMA